jgi:hypothetical protein
VAGVDYFRPCGILSLATIQEDGQKAVSGIPTVITVIAILQAQELT